MPKKKIICERCKTQILDTEQRLSLREEILKPAKVYHDFAFHSNCWVEHYNESMDKKIQSYSKRLMSVTAPAIKNLFGDLGGDGGKVITIK